MQLSAGCNGVWGQLGNRAERSVQAAPDLLWGTTYCWRVIKSNGSRDAYSATRRFTTPPPPTLDSAGFVTSTISQCTTAAASGRVRQDPNDPATNNPVTYFAEFSYVGGVDRFRELRVAFIPANVTAVASMRFNLLDNRMRNYPAFRVTNLSGTPEYSSINTNTAPFFGPTANTGTLTNAAGTASLLNLNTSGNGTSVQIIDSDTIRVTWQVEFKDTLLSNNYGVYVSGVAVAPDNVTLFSNGAGPATSVGDQLRYVRATPWIIDMTPPLTQVSTPTVTGPDTIRVTWNTSDTGTGATGLADARSYCYLSGGDPTSITDLHATLGGVIGIGNVPLDYPDPANCRVTSTSLGIRNYRIPLDLTGDLAFKLTSIDRACNIQTVTSVQPEPSPWLLSKDSSASAQGGFSKINPREVDLRNMYPEADAQDSFLSEYAAYSGTGGLPSSRASRNSFEAPNYSDDAVLPPDISTTNSWYDFIEDIVSNKTTIQTTSALTTITGSMRARLNAVGINTGNTRTIVKLETAGGTGTVVIDGTVANGGINATCDLNAVIFVHGNLTFRPNFAKTNNNVGCIFIVSGNVTVERGLNANPATRALTLPALYDQIFAMIVTDGTFTTSSDNAAGRLYDGLYIDGGVTANQFALGRTLGLVRNPSQPAEVFDYNPYYLYRFRDILEVTKYSLRER